METKKLVLAALFISLSAVGGMVKIPLGIASIALDTLPAFFYASVPALVFAATVNAAGAAIAMPSILRMTGGRSFHAT